MLCGWMKKKKFGQKVDTFYKKKNREIYKERAGQEISVVKERTGA